MSWPSRFMTIGTVLILISLAPAARSGPAFWMPASELRAVLGGATINGEYVDGRTFTESYSHEGRLTYSEVSSNRQWVGHWSVTNDRFCTIYDDSGTGGCFRVRRVSFNCFEFFFDTRTEEEALKSTPRSPTWTARAWRTSTPSTCEERPMV